MATSKIGVSGSDPLVRRQDRRALTAPIEVGAVAEDKKSSASLPPNLGGRKTAGGLNQQQVAVAQNATLPVPDNPPPNIKEAFRAGLRKGIEKFLEKSGEILAVLFWSVIVLWIIMATFGFQINLETIKALKEAFPLF